MEINSETKKENFHRFRRLGKTVKKREDINCVRSYFTRIKNVHKLN